MLLVQQWVLWVKWTIGTVTLLLYWLLNLPAPRAPKEGQIAGIKTCWKTTRTIHKTTKRTSSPGSPSVEVMVLVKFLIKASIHMEWGQTVFRIRKKLIWMVKPTWHNNRCKIKIKDISSIINRMSIWDLKATTGPVELVQDWYRIIILEAALEANSWIINLINSSIPLSKLKPASHLALQDLMFRWTRIFSKTAKQL